MPEKKICILFVCLGNICRSPLAEGIFKDLLKKEGMEDGFFVDSCGTGNWHIGRPPHDGSIHVASENGINIRDQKARQLTKEDFDEFDIIFAMDRENLQCLKQIKTGGKAKILCLREYDSEEGDFDVPDPYFKGDEEGFKDVYEIIFRCLKNYIESIKKACK